MLTTNPIANPKPEIRPLYIRKVASLLFWVVFLFSSFLQTNGFNSIDVARRFQTTHSIWQNVPAVTDQDIVDHYIVVGTHATPYYWYGMGQSIIMLPGDLVSQALFGLIHLDNNQVQEDLSPAIVSEVVFVPIGALVVVLAFLILLELDFSLYQSLGGALAFYFGTTLLHYTQMQQENTQIMALLLSGYYLHLRWLKQQRWLTLVLGSLMLGVLLLFRVTTLADILPETLFIGLVLWGKSGGWRQARSLLIQLTLSQAAAILFFGLLDRLYQLKRFGDITSNYTDVFAAQVRAGTVHAMDFPNITPDWPWSLPRQTGIINVLFSPEKSIFLYDPLLILLLVVVVGRRFRLNSEQGLSIFKGRGALLLSGLVSLLLFLVGYSNYVVWGGDTSWGARYHSSAVWLLCLLAVPLALEAWSLLARSLRWLILTLLGLSFLVQWLSVLFASGLERAQQECGIGWTFRLGQRLLNLISYLSGGGVNLPQTCPAYDRPWTTTPDFWSVWDYVSNWFPPAFRPVTDVMWLAMVGLAIWLLLRLWRKPWLRTQFEGMRLNKV